MMNRLKQRIIANYFSGQYPLDYRIYMLFFFESYFISILSAITNTVLKKGLLGLLLLWVYIIFCTAILFSPPQIRIKIEKLHLLFITFFYIPFLYFQTAGYNGTTLLFAQLGIFLLAIVFSGKTRLMIIALNILTYFACILTSYLYPHLVTPHNSSTALLIDLLVALILSFTGLAIMTVYISRVFADNSKALAELSIRDALTGVYNRRFMTDFLQKELDRARQTGNRVYVLMLDIDHFKKINDTYGHGFGDHVLLSCVRAIQSALRKSDVIARYGGEEFAIILPAQTGAKVVVVVVAVAQRICQAISLLRFRYDVTVTVSIGIGQSQPDDTIEKILGRADQCMYKAKKSGGNQAYIENQ